MRSIIATAFTVAVLSFAGTATADDDVSAQIVGGTKTSTKDHPYAVFLVKPGERTSFCGGNIIAPDKVLTAAHCADAEPGEPLPPSQVNVVAGRDDERTDAGVVAKVKKVALHPKYDGFGNDFAVLTLEKKLPYRPIRLATSKDAGLHAVGRKVTVLGWGRTSFDNPDSPRLLKTTVPVQEDNDCLKFYGKDDAGVDIYDAKLMICAGDNAGKKDSCFGDSGGPFVAGGKLVGVVSFGPANACAAKNSPAVYAKVSAALTWIKQQ